MTADITSWTGIARDWLFDADRHTKSADGWYPPTMERHPLWPRIAEQMYNREILAQMENCFMLAEHLIAQERVRAAKMSGDNDADL